jgi:hypothetical protein
MKESEPVEGEQQNTSKRKEEHEEEAINKKIKMTTNQG